MISSRAAGRRGLLFHVCGAGRTYLPGIGDVGIRRGHAATQYSLQLHHDDPKRTIRQGSYNALALSQGAHIQTSRSSLRSEIPASPSDGSARPPHSARRSRETKRRPDASESEQQPVFIERVRDHIFFAVSGPARRFRRSCWYGICGAGPAWTSCRDSPWQFSGFRHIRCRCSWPEAAGSLAAAVPHRRVASRIELYPFCRCYHSVTGDV